MGHDHANEVEGVAVDPIETAHLRNEARQAGATPVGYFLGMAADAETQYVRAYWLRRVDGARHLAERKAARATLDETAIRNMEADKRLEGTEASLEVVRIVGNACILQRVHGAYPSPGGYTLISRIAGETETHGWGRETYPGHWVPQGLRMNVVYEFAMVSHDNVTGKEVTGPWVSVPVGTLSTADIHRAEKARAQAEYEAREREQAERAAENAAANEQRHREYHEGLREQQEQADRDNAERERQRIERERIHAEAVAELPKVAPRNVSGKFRALGVTGMLLDLRFQRGEKAPNIYQFKIAGTVIGYYPDGRHSGRKPERHIYERTVDVSHLCGQRIEVHIYGVTDHGDGGEPFMLDVPTAGSLCEEPAPEKTRMDRIVDAVRSYTGRRTRRGKPYLRDLRKQSGMDDITGRERNEAFKLAQAKA